VKTHNFEIFGPDAPPAFMARAATRDGACMIRGLVSLDAIEAVKAVAESAMLASGLGLLVRDADEGPDTFNLRGSGWDDPRWLDLQVRVLGDQAVDSLRMDPGLLRALSAVCGGDVRGAQGDIVRIAPPGQQHLTTRPHQDGFYIPDSQTLWTAWVPLVPCPLDLGPLAVIPASHTAGLRGHAVADLGVPELADIEGPNTADIADTAGIWRASAMMPGDALLFGSRTVHAALPNMTRRHVRISIDLRFR